MFKSFSNKGNLLKRLTFVSTLLIVLFAMIGVQDASAQRAKKSAPLRGSASLDDKINEGGPSLSRQDINNAGDPFGDNDSFDAPADSFKSQTAMPETPAPFNLQADDSGGGFGQPMQAQPAQPAMMPQQPVNMAPPQQMQAQDPESVGHMKLAWDEWHKRVAESIYLKYANLAKVAFKRSQPLTARVSYTVTRNGQITNVQLVQRSPNLIFNTMIFGVLKSMNGNPILAFPQGSRRMTVDKTGTFLWNCNNMQGFRYTTNDNETLRQQR